MGDLAALVGDLFLGPMYQSSARGFLPLEMLRSTYVSSWSALAPFLRETLSSGQLGCSEFHGAGLR